VNPCFVFHNIWRNKEIINKITFEKDKLEILYNESQKLYDDTKYKLIDLESKYNKDVESLTNENSELKESINNKIKELSNIVLIIK